MRNAFIERKTNETDITLSLIIDGSGSREIDTGCGFLDHMLELFAAHGRFDLKVKCAGDTKVDYHHTAEDIAIVLGKAFCSALGDKSGIKRYGNALIPMDESLILAAVDISGRAALGFDLSIPSQKVGDFDTELVKEFMAALARSAGMSLHLRKLAGENSHHIIEGAFKALARALREAVSPEAGLTSTKGLID